MKKELLQKYLFLFIFFALTIIVRRWFTWGVVAYFVGGFLGVVLPYADHLIYIYVLRPSSDISQGIKALIDQKNYMPVANSFAGIQGRRTRHIFHTVYFTLIFFVLTFLVITSSGGFFGRGVVLGFCLSLLVTQYFDFRELGSIEHWFEKLNISLDKRQQRWYLIANAIVLLLFGLYV